MKLVKVYGASDDLVQIEGDIKGADEFGCFDVQPRFILSTGGGALWIDAVYNGSWAFAVGVESARDDEGMPPWPIRREWGTDCPYSETLIIECPDDATVRRTGKREE